MSKDIIAYDFDGTIVENAFPEIGDIKEDVVKEIREEKEKGSIIILWTCRSGEFLEDAVKFCKVNNIPIDYANENIPELDFETSRKIYADRYVDDRAINPNN